MRIERYLVLATTHLAWSTTSLLDRWARLGALGGPGGIYATDEGWFVALAPIEAQQLPNDLTSAVALARAMGCSHIVFDCDAVPVACLDVYPC